MISPDGKILSEKKNGEGIITALIDETLPLQLRKQIPSLNN